MQRFAFVVDVVPELREEYLRLHAAVWPEVEAALSAHHVTNYSIFVLEDTLFAYYEYVGDDHAADLAAVDADPVTQEWLSRTDPCQVPFGQGARPGDRWRALEEVWHLP
ncbi:MAG: L-rhamnose 1-epimerase [Cellulomonas sp. 73-145]|mgnify:CR=1 FL=1|uniref:L-rhamnose mutarotase n=1 Tax=Cellulomonas sp. 73-145 TaxID=1895739 RepID=UPI0009283D9E|nr:L-rhamnose mutarotase [Cellulomonas sp. 73-145]OJV59836.1 MAG: L-rhamnose 1-epimerase [Cellulomonas sp. 73-145]